MERSLNEGRSLKKPLHPVAALLPHRTVGYWMPSCSRYDAYFEGS